MADPTLFLSHGAWRMEIAPWLGGSILALDWRGQAVLRRGGGRSIWDVASYPLVPFSNRIAWGRFMAGGRDVVLAPNFPGGGHPHTIHGFGWLAPWTVAQVGADSATLTYDHAAGEWPWDFTARQEFVLGDGGMSLTLTLTNRGARVMPAGLGIHPYFPRDDRTIYHGRHRGEWRNSPDCLPVALEERAQAVDWWRGAPVGSRVVDTAYTGREGPLTLRWPDRDLVVEMRLSDTLGVTVVYTPPGEDYVCIEPVSHGTDAVNRDVAGETGLVWLAPGDSMEARVEFVAHSG